MVVRQQDHKLLDLMSRKSERDNFFQFGDNNFENVGKRKLFALLVEDAIENQFLMSRILSTLGIEVEIASNGQEAVEKALDAQHDFILMDMQMPVLDGYDASRMLRDLGYAKPIIALTAHCLPEEHERILASGCDAHLTKPINFLLLLQTIVEHTHVNI